MSARRKKSFADVTRRKGRTFMVVMGIFIGVFGLTVINFTQATIFNAYAYSMGSAANYPDVDVAVDKLVPALTSSLAAVNNVQALQMQAEINTSWNVSSAPQGGFGMDILSFPDLHQVAITPFQLTSGRYPGVGEIVLEYGDQQLQRIALGDTVTVNTSPDATTTLKVVGFARTQGLASPVSTQTARGYVSMDGFQRAFGATVSSQNGPQLRYAVAFKVKNTKLESSTATAVAALLKANGVTVKGIAYPTPFNTALLTALGGVFTLLRLLAILAVLLSSMLILNTILTLVAEQTQIMGMMKALGGTRGTILRGYLVSVWIYSMLGTLPGIALGLVLGYPLASALVNDIDLGPFSVDPWIVILSLGVGFGVPLLAAFMPLWVGTRITVREAFAGYGISSGQSRRRVRSSGERMGLLSQTTWLGLRGVFRRRGRAILTLLTLTLAGATFLTVQTTSTSTNQMIADITANSHYDVQADVPPEGTQAQTLSSQIQALTNVKRVETATEVEGLTTQWGKVDMKGFQVDTQIYQPTLLSGRWFTANDTNAVLINERFAQTSGLQVGQALLVSNLTLTVIGIVHQPQLDLQRVGELITTNDVSNLLGTSDTNLGIVTELLVQARDNEASALVTLVNQIDQFYPSGGAGPSIGGSGPVMTHQALVAQQQQGFYVFYALLYSVALIVGSVGILGLANALAASVLERKREIGIVRSMGGSAFRVAQIFWVEGMSLGGIALLLGALVGIPMAYGFVQVMSKLLLQVDFLLDASALMVMVVAVLLIATLASIIPAFRASQLRIADMLRYE
ncbi:MAG TPA: FtsX-like permease family protein [Ktedonobacteraceae bacterium]|nr:FtsX-like permease family protein [Ktedonobacteraceae bacterium]